MLGFGSRDFGEAYYGHTALQLTVDEVLTTSTMQVAGYNFINTCTLEAKGVVNVDIAAGMVRLGYLDVTPNATIIASGIKMEWGAWTNLGQGTTTMNASGSIAWDSQLVDDAIWTTQTVS